MRGVIAVEGLPILNVAIGIQAKKDSENDEEVNVQLQHTLIFEGEMRNFSIIVTKSLHLNIDTGHSLV